MPFPDESWLSGTSDRGGRTLRHGSIGLAPTVMGNQVHRLVGTMRQDVSGDEDEVSGVAHELAGLGAIDVKNVDLCDKNGKTGSLMIRIASYVTSNEQLRTVCIFDGMEPGNIRS